MLEKIHSFQHQKRLINLYSHAIQFKNKHAKDKSQTYMIMNLMVKILHLMLQN